MSENTNYAAFRIADSDMREWYTRILLVYREHSRLFFAISLPAVIFSYVAIQGSLVIVARVNAYLRIELRASPDLHAFVTEHIWQMLGMGAARWGGFFATWIISCFAFGAVAVAVESISRQREIGSEEAYSHVREHSGAFLRSAAVLFAGIFGGMVLAWIGATSIPFELVEKSRHPVLVMDTISVVVFLAILWLFVRFAFVLPLIVLENLAGFEAFQKSEILTEGVRGRLFYLVIESEVAGYVGAQLPYWIFSAIPKTVQSPSWIGWVLIGFSIIFVALAQLPMMIGISQAYLEAADSERTAAAARAIAVGNLSG